KLYQKGDYDAATRLAYKAEKLHGPYSIWDLGDRPAKVIEDVQVARAKARRATPIRKPDQAGTPPTVLVKNQPKPDPTATKTGPAVPPPVPGLAGVPKAPARPDGTIKLRAQQLVAQAQRYQREGKLVEARQKALEGQRLGAKFEHDEVSPELV